MLLTRSISTIITLAIDLANAIVIAISFVISLCIILQFFLLFVIEVVAIVFIVELAIGCLLLVILIAVIDVLPSSSFISEAPIDNVLTDEDDALDALVRGTLLLACIVYNEALLLGQEGGRPSK